MHPSVKNRATYAYHCEKHPHRATATYRNSAKRSCYNSDSFLMGGINHASSLRTQDQNLVCSLLLQVEYISTCTVSTCSLQISACDNLGGIKLILYFTASTTLCAKATGKFCTLFQEDLAFFCTGFFNFHSKFTYHCSVTTSNTAYVNSSQHRTAHHHVALEMKHIVTN